jgi:hypothetical protein
MQDGSGRRASTWKKRESVANRMTGMLSEGDDTALGAVIRRAREDVRAYHAGLDRDPACARIDLGGASQLLLPSRVIGLDLPRILDQLCGPVASADAIYSLGCQIGQSHATAFLAASRSDSSDPLYRLLSGPFHFAWAGYGDVDLLILEAHLDDRFAILWESEHSAIALAAAGEKRRSRVCHLHAGYSAGWSREALGVPVDGRELACYAEGVARCRFLLAHTQKLDARLVEPRFHQPPDRYARARVRVVPCPPDA